jgi:hypothetical protein
MSTFGLFSLSSFRSFSHHGLPLFLSKRIGSFYPGVFQDLGLAVSTAAGHPFISRIILFLFLKFFVKDPSKSGSPKQEKGRERPVQERNLNVEGGPRKRRANNTDQGEIAKGSTSDVLRPLRGKSGDPTHGIPNEHEESVHPAPARATSAYQASRTMSPSPSLNDFTAPSSRWADSPPPCIRYPEPEKAFDPHREADVHYDRDTTDKYSDFAATSATGWYPTGSIHLHLSIAISHVQPCGCLPHSAMVGVGCIPQ